MQGTAVRQTGGQPPPAGPSVQVTRKPNGDVLLEFT
jgi:hypothetical protein